MHSSKGRRPTLTFTNRERESNSSFCLAQTNNRLACHARPFNWPPEMRSPGKNDGPFFPGLCQDWCFRFLLLPPVAIIVSIHNPFPFPFPTTLYASVLCGGSLETRNRRSNGDYLCVFTTTGDVLSIRKTL